jgi:rsbT antagonist protein RsbS
MERIPILQMGEFLLVTIQVDMHDRLAMTLQDDLTNRITQTSARGVLIDISSLDMVDSLLDESWETLPKCHGCLMLRL